MLPNQPIVLTLPGWQNSGPSHWQSLWEAAHGDVRVQQHDWMTPRRGDWLIQLEEAVLACATPGSPPLLLAAHSLGCHLVAAWAAHSLNTHLVAGALLVAPPDPQRPDFPDELAGWRKPVAYRSSEPPNLRAPASQLPFRSTLVASTDDPYCSLAAAQALAATWGSHVHILGAFGHINADTGLNDWPEGRALLLGLHQGGPQAKGACGATPAQT